MQDSDFLNGLEYKAAMKAIIAHLETTGSGEGTINYRLRDAIFSRQRYWGEPIPVYYKNGLPVPLSQDHLPLVLPKVEKLFTHSRWGSAIRECDSLGMGYKE